MFEGLILTFLDLGFAGEIVNVSLDSLDQVLWRRSKSK